MCFELLLPPLPRPSPLLDRPHPPLWLNDVVNPVPAGHHDRPESEVDR